MGKIIEVDVDEVKKVLDNNAIKLTNSIISTVREYYIPKDEYENRLKADMVAMLTEIQLEIESYKLSEPTLKTEYDQGLFNAQNGMIEEISRIIQEKINALKSESES